jgi:glycosyltransferase involved in cell wall biosynthesis
MVKVCLRRGYHSVYDELINYPPEGVEFTIPRLTSSNRKAPFDELKRRIYLKYLHMTNQPNVILINPQHADVIHSCGGIIPLNQKEPWVMDVEHAASFVGFQAGRLEKVHGKIEKLLARKACRKILPWTNAGLMSLRNALDTKSFEDRMEVVYPAMHLPEKLQKQKSETGATRMLFVSVRFFTKGGMEVLQAYDALRDSLDIELTVVSEVPAALKKKYPEVEFHEPSIPRQRLLDEFYTRADVFVLPSYMDTYGMVYLEAMAYEMPVIGSNCFAIPELIEGAGLAVDVSSISWYGKDYLFAWKSWEEFCAAMETREKPDIVMDLTRKMKTMIEDSAMRQRMAREGRAKLEPGGKLSIETRNKAMKRIYEEAARR